MRRVAVRLRASKASQHSISSMRDRQLLSTTHIFLIPSPPLVSAQGVAY